MKQHFVLNSFDEVEALFGANAAVLSDSLSYTQSYKVGPSTIIQMNSYEFNFEPYISLATSLGMSHFRINGTDKGFYLTHINLGGHGPLCTVRPVNLAQLKDVEYLTNLKANYCCNLEINSVPIEDSWL